ncbi:hypothetical protein [Armatimonas rosea]|uniref:Uncharacterized protein n=1 Tax=Armatimonas rosea TaxID=685828 RepID=A0A7W9W5E7_ARMRO|nr:hypothetical protein [Armatimonas rosea]MBB6049488.1 hypothetical protein [Armatimonas rosea]
MDLIQIEKQIKFQLNDNPLIRFGTKFNLEYFIYLKSSIDFKIKLLDLFNDFYTCHYKEDVNAMASVLKGMFPSDIAEICNNYNDGYIDENMFHKALDKCQENIEKVKYEINHHKNHGEFINHYINFIDLSLKIAFMVLSHDYRKIIYIL